MESIRMMLLVGVALGATAGVALAADVEARSRIDAVTVYPDGAIVTRTVEIDLPQGGHTLVFRGLPLSIDPASLRVEGQATGALTLGAVESRLRPVDPAKAQSETDSQLRPLREQRDRLLALIDAHDGRKAMIQRFAQSGPERGEKAGGLDVAQWSGAWEAVGVALAKVNDDLRVAREQQREIETKIKAMELGDPARRSPVAPEREFAVALEAGQAVKGQLTLSYRVGGASWQPGYDARLTTGEGGKASGLTLARRALVSQRTGEDWSGVDVTLSTVRAARGTAAPDVQPLRVSFFEVPVVMSAPRPAAVAADKMMRAQVAESMQKMEASPAAPAVRMAAAEATLETGGFQAAYRIPGKLTVPSDGSQKSFIVQSREIQPDLVVRAVPALDPAAYLEAAFVNAEDAPLLAGTVNLIRDGAFIGRGRIAFTAPGDKVALGFGADDRVQVARVPLRRRETEPGILGSTKSDTREFRITVRNLHDFPIKAVIVDQIPFSESANLVVEPLPTMTPATDKMVQDKRGVMGWSYDLKPREDREIRVGYRLRWPSDRELSFEPAPNPR